MNELFDVAVNSRRSLCSLLLRFAVVADRRYLQRKSLLRNQQNSALSVSGGKQLDRTSQIFDYWFWRSEKIASY